MGIILFSCDTENATYRPTNIKVKGTPLNILEMDGCEYMSKSIGGQTGLLAHRGNCKFCREWQIKTMDSIIKANYDR